MFWIASAILVAIDYFTKRLAVSLLALNEPVNCIPGLLDFRYIRNPGAAYNMLTGNIRLLSAFTVLLLVGVVVYYYWDKKNLNLFQRICVILIFAGGMGNLIDRISLGYVIDFIDIHIIPVFNFADICITCGCILYMICVLWPRKNTESEIDK